MERSQDGKGGTLLTAARSASFDRAACEAFAPRRASVQGQARWLGSSLTLWVVWGTRWSFMLSDVPITPLLSLKIADFHLPAVPGPGIDTC